MFQLENKEKYGMMSEIYLFQFSKNNFCGKIKSTIYRVKIKKKIVASFALMLDFILFRKIIIFSFQPYEYL